MSDKIVTSSIDEKEKKRRGGRGREGEEKEKARNRDALVSWMCARKRKKPVTLFSVPRVRGLIAKLIEIA